MPGRRDSARYLDRIGHPQRPATLDLLPTHLVVRESCGCTPDAVRTHPVRGAAAPIAVVANSDRFLRSYGTDTSAQHISLQRPIGIPIGGLSTLKSNRSVSV